MTAPDFAGVLAAHPAWKSWYATMFAGIKCSGCGENMTGYAGYPGREASDRLHRAHVAAALDAEVAAWLGSEAAKPETERTNGAVALAALAEQVGPS